MAEGNIQPLRNKRRRRRRPDKSPISAHLIFDDHLDGDYGFLSGDLIEELFPDCSQPLEEEIRYVALLPWAPLSPNIVQDSPWTIIPVRLGQPQTRLLAHSTVQFPLSSDALQRFNLSLRSYIPSKQSHKSIEIRVIDVVPCSIHSVYVTVDEELVKRVEEHISIPNDSHTPRRTNVSFQKGKQNKRGPITSTYPGSKGIGLLTPAQEKYLRDALRTSLKPPSLVHSGDLLSLPIFSHPITHVAPPPAKVVHCEPVSQGFLSPDTRFIVSKIDNAGSSANDLQTPSPQWNNQNTSLEDDEDASDDKFYSAAEERANTSTNTSPDSADVFSSEHSETESSASENGELSDDSLGDVISIRTPLLTTHSTVATNSDTPYGLGDGRQTNGVNTPGSAFSSFTATTARPAGSKGKLFKAVALMQKIHDEFLHPKPAAEEDEEARVYVDVAVLVKLSCFSGDWIRIQPSPNPSTLDIGSWGLGPFANSDEETSIWRAVKIYSLPESFVSRQKHIYYPKNPDRRPVYPESGSIQGTSHKVYLSPILLANLNTPSYLQLAPFLSLRRPSSSHKASHILKPRLSSSPPVAKEVSLLKVSSPLSTDRALQPAIFSSLKRVFESKRRVVKIGDLIGVNVDENIGRLLQARSANDAEPTTRDDLDFESLTDNEVGTSSPTPSSMAGIAWFKIGQLVLESENDAEAEPGFNSGIWGGVAIIDSHTTRMVQAKSTNGRIPSIRTSPWEYYLGIRFSAAISIRSIDMGLSPVAILLVSTQRNIGKSTLSTRACADLGLHTFVIDAFDILAEGGSSGGDLKTEAFLKARSERALNCGADCCALVLKHIEALTADRMTSALRGVIADSRVLIATTTEVGKIPDGIRALFTHELEIKAPGEDERESLLREIIGEKGVAISPDADLAAVAIKTASLVVGDLVEVVDRATIARRERIEALARNAPKISASSVGITARDILIAGGPFGRCVTKADFDIAVDAARKNFADAIGAPKIPNVSWDDVGGLTNVKDAVMETIQLPLERPELFAKGMKKRSGILFYGKTLLAKAIATEFSLNFFSVKGPELLNMYIGESEANVRRVFQRARDARPCVVFFDELDSVAPKRGNQGDSGGVMDRIVSQLLAELDGMSDGDDGGGGVFVIGATNRPDLLDAALLRPGRFDKMLYLGVSDSHSKQLTILEALTRKFSLDPGLSLRKISESLPFTYTGADLYALCSDAMLKAITRQATAVDYKIKSIPGKPVTPAQFFDKIASPEDLAVKVTEQDFFAAQRELVGSVSAKELEHYQQVRSMFESTGKSDEEGLAAIM
ncbi:MAG: peroxisomal assembly protein [Trizodia sp. TS-e1964]|nr:MAG: peroxisomal assembly protein [Trizodia sp. TS-e1964]